MMLADALSTGQIGFLVLAIGMALAFEFVNGFHDTANAVATVIYTNSLRPWAAVIWSGIWNFLGVLTSSGGVAFSILALIPVELVLNVGSSTGFAMVFALLISAIIWNVGTWYLGLPASSSHALIGSIMGVGFANAFFSGSGGLASGVNWAKVSEIALALVISPLVGFVFSALLVLIGKHLLRAKTLFEPPRKGLPPPKGIRALLILTCTGVSFGHGSNDGQKGMGLVLLILVGILPGTYALRPHMGAAAMHRLEVTSVAAQPVLEARAVGAEPIAPGGALDVASAYLKSSAKPTASTYAALASVNRNISTTLAGRDDFANFDDLQKKTLRGEIYVLSAALGKLDSKGELKAKPERDILLDGSGVGAVAYRKQLDGVTKFIPVWVKAAVALALGLGTMIGWKRIVVTVGEKIGKDHLTYGQGAAAELVAAGTLLAAEFYKLPVSTTHVLSSGIAGTMAANRSGIQMGTLRNLLLAWVLTLPACMLLGAATFAAGVYVILNHLYPVLMATAALGLILVTLTAVKYSRRKLRKSEVSDVVIPHRDGIEAVAEGAVSLGSDRREVSMIGRGEASARVPRQRQDGNPNAAPPATSTR